MATLTPTQLTQLRQQVAASLTSIGFTKPQINTALQALEDWYETSGRAEAGAAIEAAAPGVFTGPQKVKLGKYWLLQKAGRE
jgi:uncharacterized protein Smg (DUF494 family)